MMMAMIMTPAVSAERPRARSFMLLLPVMGWLGVDT
jgi:hypothetical protein